MSSQTLPFAPDSWNVTHLLPGAGTGLTSPRRRRRRRRRRSEELQDTQSPRNDFNSFLSEKSIKLWIYPSCHHHHAAAAASISKPAAPPCQFYAPFKLSTSTST
jgi:hypothetical protein